MALSKKDMQELGGLIESAIKAGGWFWKKSWKKPLQGNRETAFPLS